jgi:hypothetical protein
MSGIKICRKFLEARLECNPSNIMEEVLILESARVHRALINASFTGQLILAAPPPKCQDSHNDRVK